MSINGGMEVKKVFIGAGCNRVVNNVSWGACDLVAFGAQNAVAIFSPKVPLSSSFHSINTHLPIYHQTDLFLSFVFWAVFQFFFYFFADCTDSDNSTGSQSLCELHPMASK